MKNFAVASVSFLDNDLTLKVTKATDWRDAFRKTFPGESEYLPSELSLEEAKEEAFNQDWLFNVIEIPAGE